MLTSCSMPGSVLNNLNEISHVNLPTQQDRNYSEPVLEMRTPRLRKQCAQDPWATWMASGSTLAGSRAAGLIRMGP